MLCQRDAERSDCCFRSLLVVESVQMQVEPLPPCRAGEVLQENSNSSLHGVTADHHFVQFASPAGTCQMLFRKCVSMNDRALTFVSEPPRMLSLCIGAPVKIALRCRSTFMLTQPLHTPPLQTRRTLSSRSGWRAGAGKPWVRALSASLGRKP